MFNVKSVSQTVVDDLVSQYNSGGATLTSVAITLGCSVPTAGRLLKKNGATMRAKGRPPGSKTVNRKVVSLTDASGAAVLEPGRLVGVYSDDERQQEGDFEETSVAASGTPTTPTNESFLEFQQKVMNFSKV